MFRCYRDSKTSKTLLSVRTLWRHSSIFFCAFFLHIINVSMSCQINSCQNIMSDQTCTLRRKCRAWYLLHQIYLQFTLLTGWWPLFFHRWLPLTTNFLHFDEKICMWGLAYFTFSALVCILLQGLLYLEEWHHWQNFFCRLILLNWV